MPNQNVSPVLAQAPPISLVPYGNFGIQFSANNANATARRIANGAKPDPAWYQAAGGNPAVYITPTNIYGYYPMGQTEPQELDEIADARNVVPFMLANQAATFQEEQNCGIITVNGGPAWTPGNERADIITASVTVKESICALIALGYTFPYAADIAQQYLSVSGLCIDSLGNPNTAGAVADAGGRNTPGSWNILDPALVDPTGTAYFYSDYQDDVSLYLDTTTGLVGGFNPASPQVELMGSVYLPYLSSYSKAEGPMLVQGLQGPYPQPANWQQLLWNQIYGGGGLMMSGNPLAATAMGFENLCLAYRLAFGDQGDAMGSFLAQVNTNWVTYYVAVQAEASLIKQTGQQMATAAGKAYSIWHYISPIPITTTDYKVLQSGPRFNGAGAFPGKLQAWIITGYASGVQPFLVTPPGNPTGGAWYTPDKNGSPYTAPVMLNPQFQFIAELLWRARVCYWFAAGGYQLVDGSDGGMWSSVFKFIAQTGTNLTLPLPATVPSTPLTPAQSAFPHFTTNSQWGDLAGAQSQGLVTAQQLANLFQTAVVSDLFLADLLGLMPGTPAGPIGSSGDVGPGTPNSVNTSSPLYNAAVAADFYSNPNNVTLRDAWIATPPTAQATWTPTTIPISVPPAQGPTIDYGPYGAPESGPTVA